jgi:hypothetical protein
MSFIKCSLCSIFPEIPLRKDGKVLKVTMKLGTVFHACNPSYTGGHKERITVQASPGQKCHTLIEK